ncbi:hypothetical protein NEMBOFW57_001581 [Staphylotrichum longicolle]|uniref:JmjC domain-containing protein n=1 Tax=Staphylotrichum longicolle TaxID=669026 RepID=A0AAD4F4Q0_9PEZI|nr:hypothetical protein NEMBOFW57_001581 [Staphylotrichum longicolle]
MDACQAKVDSISGEVSQISDALRGYLEQGIASGRQVQPPGTKAGRDLLQHLLGRLDQVSTGLSDVRKLATPHSSPSPSVIRAPDTPSPSVIPIPILAISHQTHPASGQVGHQIPQNTSNTTSNTTISSTTASNTTTSGPPEVPVPRPETTQALSAPVSEALPVTIPNPLLISRQGIRLSDGSVYGSPVPCGRASPLFDCTYKDIHILNEELFELYSSHPIVRDVGYFKIQVRDLPPLNVQKVARPSKDHATSFSYKADRLGLVKVDTGKRFKFSSPNLPLPMSTKMDWSLAEQRDLWNSSAADPPKGTWPYIIGNPLFYDVELSPGEKLRRRGRATLEGINTQYVYFNLTGKTITTMHREDAHVRSENLLRSGQHKFWCFVKPAFSKKLEERMALEYPEMRRCSQAVRHLSRHIPPAKLDEWGVEYTLDYCVPGQAVVTEPGTYHQVLNLGPNYAIAINLEYNSSPDMPLDYHFCDRHCPDKFAMSADDFRIYEKPPQHDNDQLPRTPETTGSQERHATALALEDLSKRRPEHPVPQPIQSATPPPEKASPEKVEPGESLSVPKSATCQLPEQGNGQTSAPDAVQGTTVPDSAPIWTNVAQPQQLNPLRVPALIPTPEQKLSSPSMPAEQRNQSPLETQYPVPDGAAYSAQVFPQAFPQAHSINQQDIYYPGHHGPRMGQLPPLRKTARMINPDREYDEPTPRPLKKQKVESSPAPVAQDSPARGAFEHLSTILRGRETNRAGSLIADKLSGKPAFERLAHLVREWRRYSKSTPMVLGGFNLFKSVEETRYGYPELHVFLSRLFKMKIAAFMEPPTAGSGQKSPQNSANVLLQRMGWDETKRSQLHDYLREGKCWATISGGYDGLLCFIPPGSECLDLALFKNEVAQLHAELDTDFVRGLCAVGAILQRSIWDCLELPEFIWESVTTTWLPVERISPLLAPFRLLKSNYYDEKSGFYWPRPAGWDWDWPTDPSAVRPGDKACSLCPRKSCRCAEVKVPQIPRISDDRSKGPGVRSVGSHRANDILGELVGELVPPGACAGDWALALRRPDLDDEPVADIYPRRMGNWVRKVCHSSDPSAMFRMMKISGRWRQMLVAVRDIGDGEEITAKYGKGFLKEQPYSLVEGLH